MKLLTILHLGCGYYRSDLVDDRINRSYPNIDMKVIGSEWCGNDDQYGWENEQNKKNVNTYLPFECIIKRKDNDDDGDDDDGGGGGNDDDEYINESRLGYFTMEDEIKAGGLFQYWNKNINKKSKKRVSILDVLEHNDVIELWYYNGKRDMLEKGKMSICNLNIGRSSS